MAGEFNERGKLRQEIQDNPEAFVTPTQAYTTNRQKVIEILLEQLQDSIDKPGEVSPPRKIN